jgi:anti-anti-sigma factor
VRYAPGPDRRLSRRSSGRRPWWAGSAPEPAPAVRLDWHSAGGRAVVAVAGDLDARAADELADFVTRRPLPAGTRPELDLAGVASVGSVGAASLAVLRRRCEQRRVHLRLRGAPRSVWRVFEETGLDAAFAAPAEEDAGPAVEQELALF